MLDANEGSENVPRRLGGHKMLKGSISALLVGIVSMALAPGSASAQAVWKGYTFFSTTNHPDYQHLEKLANEFARLSDNRIQVRVNVGGSLPIPGTAVTQAIGDGTLTFAHDGFFTGNVPIGGLTHLPMLTPTHDDFRKAVAILEPYLARELEKKGVKLLATYNFPLQTIWAVNKLTSLADIKGKKMRVNNQPQADFMRRFEATPVTLATPDVAPALERATVEGLTTASAGGGRLWGDMLKYNFRLALNYDLMLIIANKDAFDKLPADLQAKFVEAARKDALELTKELADSEDEVTAQLKGKGMVVTVPDDSIRNEAAGRVREYWDQWAKNIGPAAVEALAKVRAEIKQ
jgi:TRAP-type C4-dicarboxylate transport system substrate-binding protein